MILARPYYGTDYPMVSEWWKGHGWDAVPEAFLPGIGVVMHEDEKPLAVGWIKIEMTTPIAMMEWAVTNPHNTARESMEALKQLIDQIKHSVKNMGRSALFTYCKQPSLARFYERNGFTRTDSDMIHLVCNL